MKSGVDYVGVGIGVMILKDGKVLLHKRKNIRGDGMWALPGGHLEVNEGFDDCAKREINEELGIDIKPIKVITVSNDIAYGVHYVTIGIMAEIISGEPKIMEPDKCSEIKWFEFNKLPENLFNPSKSIIIQYKDGSLGKHF